MRYYKSNRRSYKSRSKRRYAKRTSKYTKTAKLAPSTKKAINKLINQSIETKQAFTTSGNSLIYYNSGINANGDITPILPAIAGGSGDATRNGSQVMAKSLNVKGYLKLVLNDTVDNTAYPQVIVRMMVVSLKTHQNYTNVSTQGTSLGALLRKGATVGAFSGNLSDIYAPINNELFTVHYDKKFYLNQTFLNAIGASQPSQTIPQDLKNTVKFFNLNVKCKNKVLKYDPTYTDSVYPTNWAPFLVLGYAHLDGSSPDTVTTKIGLQYDAVLNYKDA